MRRTPLLSRSRTSRAGLCRVAAWVWLGLVLAGCRPSAQSPPEPPPAEPRASLLIAQDLTFRLPPGWSAGSPVLASAESSVIAPLAVERGGLLPRVELEQMRPEDDALVTSLNPADPLGAYLTMQTRVLTDQGAGEIIAGGEWRHPDLVDGRWSHLAGPLPALLGSSAGFRGIWVGRTATGAVFVVRGYGRLPSDLAAVDQVVAGLGFPTTPPPATGQ